MPIQSTCKNTHNTQEAVRSLVKSTATRTPSPSGRRGRGLMIGGLIRPMTRPLHGPILYLKILSPVDASYFYLKYFKIGKKSDRILFDLSVSSFPLPLLPTPRECLFSCSLFCCKYLLHELYAMIVL